MARTVKEVALGTRAARTKLRPQRKPHWRTVEHGLHLGFYKPDGVGRVGSWVARRYIGDQRYETQTLGLADDQPGVPADGERVLSFDQAAKAARAWGRARREADVAAALVAQRATTVADAVERYLAARAERDPQQAHAARMRFAHHVLASPLADKPVATLRERDLTEWRAGLVRGGRRMKGEPLSPSTIKRQCNDLRAALAAAARRGRCGPDVLSAIKEGLRPPANADQPRERQVLTDADVRCIVLAAREVDPDFGDLVMMLAATGARLSQVAALRVCDLQADRIMLPVSRKGVGNKPRTHIALPLAPDVLVRLRQLAAGRVGQEPLMTRDRKTKVRTARLVGWKIMGREAWGPARQMGRPWAAALAAAGLPRTLTPYCLRHSSIVRGLCAGLPVRLVAAVHDTSVAMIEKHYGAFIVDATEDLLRRAVVPLAPATPTLIRSASDR